MRNDYQARYVESDTWAPTGQEETDWMTEFVGNGKVVPHASEHFATKAELRAMRKEIDELGQAFVHFLINHARRSGE